MADSGPGEVRDFREGQEVFVRRTAGNLEQWTVVVADRGRIMVANRTGDTKRYERAVLSQVQDMAEKSGMRLFPVRDPGPGRLLEWWAGLTPRQQLRIGQATRMWLRGHRPEVPGFVRGQGALELYELAMARISRLDRWGKGVV